MSAKRAARSSRRGAHGSSERGSVLLAVTLLAAVSVAMSASMILRATALASELRAHRNVLCARYAALGGLALGSARIDPVATAALVGPEVSRLAVFWVRPGPTWCVLRASASCQSATRTLDRTMSDVAACSTPPI
ncbi:MAG TPA: hypothetical protein VN634_06535 [Candidatus Limnocylindrales bacterium]|nr:hypothetical protein [Candidatus Limnocylindrales bacterium]